MSNQEKKEELKKQNNRKMDEKTEPDSDNKSIANEKEWDPKTSLKQPKSKNPDRP